MQTGASPARRARAQHRHELRSLTYVTFDEGNGGVVRNLTHAGAAVQAVTAVFPGQHLRVRFELRSPRLMVAVHGEVVWATDSGQCGIRFLGVSPRMKRQIDEWIFGGLLAGLPPHVGRDDPARFLTLVAPASEGEYDGLMVSAAPLKVIELPSQPEAAYVHGNVADFSRETPAELDWLSQPLSGRGLAWTVDTLAILAALLLFALVFLAVTRESPQRPFALAGLAAVLVSALYWGFFRVFAGGSPGARLARLKDSGAEEEDGARFR